MGHELPMFSRSHENNEASYNHKPSIVTLLQNYKTKSEQLGNTQRSDVESGYEHHFYQLLEKNQNNPVEIVKILLRAEATPNLNASSYFNELTDGLMENVLCPPDTNPDDCDLMSKYRLCRFLHQNYMEYLIDHDFAMIVRMQGIVPRQKMMTLSSLKQSGLIDKNPSLVQSVLQAESFILPQLDKRINTLDQYLLNNNIEGGIKQIIDESVLQKTKSQNNQLLITIHLLHHCFLVAPDKLAESLPANDKAHIPKVDFNGQALALIEQKLELVDSIRQAREPLKQAEYLLAEKAVWQNLKACHDDNEAIEAYKRFNAMLTDDGDNRRAFNKAREFINNELAQQITVDLNHNATNDSLAESSNSGSEAHYQNRLNSNDDLDGGQETDYQLNRSLEQFNGDNLVIGCGKKHPHAAKAHPENSYYTMDIDDKINPDLVFDFKLPVPSDLGLSNRFSYIKCEGLPFFVFQGASHALTNINQMLASTGKALISTSLSSLEEHNYPGYFEEQAKRLGMYSYRPSVEETGLSAYTGLLFFHQDEGNVVVSKSKKPLND